MHPRVPWFFRRFPRDCLPRTSCLNAASPDGRNQPARWTPVARGLCKHARGPGADPRPRPWPRQVALPGRPLSAPRGGRAGPGGFAREEAGVGVFGCIVHPDPQHARFPPPFRPILTGAGQLPMVQDLTRDRLSVSGLWLIFNSFRCDSEFFQVCRAGRRSYGHE